MSKQSGWHSKGLGGPAIFLILIVIYWRYRFRYGRKSRGGFHRSSPTLKHWASVIS